MVSQYLINAKVRALGEKVRRRREALNITQTDLAQRVGWSGPALSRFENRQGWPPKVDLELGMAQILGALGVQGNEFGQFMELVHQAKQPNWLAVGAAGHSDQFRTFVGYEAEATKITTVGLLHIPGLLQIHDYARAVLARRDIRPDDLDTQVAVRLERQKVLDREGVRYLAIIDEPVLTRRRGGPAVLVRQLRHIQDLCRRSNIDVQIIPDDTELVIDGGYTLLEFSDQSPVGYADGRLGGVLADQPEGMEQVARDTDTVRESAISPAESIELIGDVLARLEST